MPEKSLGVRVRLAAPKHNARLFRNQVGHYLLADGRRLTSGLGVGSPDLIGWQSVTITPEMVGNQVAMFVGLELKTGNKKPTAKQEAWLKAIHGAGGLARVIRSEQEAEELLALHLCPPRVK